MVAGNLVLQRRRILNRIHATKKLIQEGRVDRKFKYSAILPSLQIALSRTYTGMYGLCIDCGCQIPSKRLEKTPGAIRCVKCQSNHEK